MTQRRDVEAIYPLSPMQQGMLFHSLETPDAAMYFEQFRCELRGTLDVDAFRSAWQRILDRHPVLRTLFVWKQQHRMLQLVRRNLELPWTYEDWRGLPANEQHTKLQALLIADRKRGFQLDRAPLMRVTVVRTGEDRHRMIWSFHHAILDGWSVSILFQELFAFYRAAGGRECDLAPPRPYRDYIAWLRTRDHEAAERAWTEALRGVTAATRLVLPGAPSATTAHQEQGYQQAQLELSAEATTELRALARRHQLTLNTLIQGVWALLLGCYTDHDDLLFGATVSDRPAELPGVDAMVGLFLNTLPIRVSVASDLPVTDWLQALQGEQARLRAYSYAAVSDIQRWSGLSRRERLFESIVLFENHPMDQPFTGGDGGLEVVGAEVFEHTNYPLLLVSGPAPKLPLILRFDPRQYEPSSMQQVVQHLANLLLAIVADPQCPVARLSPLSAEEAQRQAVTWNLTKVEHADQRGLLELFAAQVAHNPDSIAFFDDDTSLSYRMLDQRASAIAQDLSSIGIAKGDTVGLCIERSLDAVTGFLGIIKVGAVYLPLDPTYPQQRLDFMLRDAGANLVVTHERHRGWLQRAGYQCLLIEGIANSPASPEAVFPPLRIRPEDRAYVIYTSGSTGQPKGVAIPHRQLLNRLRWMWSQYPFANDEVSCQKTALSFVDSLWELLGPLLGGSPTLILHDAQVRDPKALVDALSRHRVTRLWLVPSLLQAILDTAPDLATRLPRLRFWVSSGEPLTTDLLARFQRAMPHATLYNLYGTSEFWDATWYAPRPEHCHLLQAPIGRPIHNTRCYILDRHRRLVPVGVVGELFVAGAQLPDAFLNQPDLERQRLLPDHFSDDPAARLIASGDLARYLPDGCIEFVDRIDHQVKIRGYRIELGEIEAALNAIPGVHQAVVVARSEHGDKRLVAYFIPDRSARRPGPSGQELRAQLQRSLPEHMVPKQFAALERFPLTSSGKIERRALPAPEPDQHASPSPKAAPATAHEIAIAAAFSELLGLEQVGLDDNFFDLGGHSLLGLRLLVELEQRLGVSLTLPTLFAAPTVADLAEAVELSGGKSTFNSMLPIRATGKGAPFFCVHGDPSALAPHLDRGQPYYWLHHALSTKVVPYVTVPEVAASHLTELRMVQPRGPYYLGGFSFGGAVAFEMAQQLRAAEQEVALLALFDAVPPRHLEPRRSEKVGRHVSAMAELGPGARLAYLLSTGRRLVKARANYVRRLSKSHWDQARFAFYDRKGEGTPASLIVSHRLRQFRRAARSYRYRPYEGDAVVFVPGQGEATEERIAKAEQRWRQLIRGRLEIHVVGSAKRHTDLFRQPFSRELAEQLNPYMPNRKGPA